MFTIFTLRKYNHTGLGKIFNLFRKDKITEVYREVQNLTVRNITYINHKKWVNWEAVFQRAGYESKCLVCSEDVRLPHGTGLKRFYDNSFNMRMAENFASAVIKNIESPEKLNIALLDYDGSRGEFAEYLSKYTENFIVVTADKRKYADVCKKLMEEQGISLVLTNRLSRLEKCDLVICPSKIKKPFSISKNSVVITGEKPACNVDALCYTDYKVTLPYEYRDILTDDIDEVYLAGCLYSRGRQYVLGNLLPTVAYNNGTTATVATLAKYLSKMCEK